MKPFDDIQVYLDTLQPEHRAILEIYLKKVQIVHPDVVFVMKYGIPTCVKKNRNILHLAANKNHLGIYPGPSMIRWLLSKDEQLLTSKGTWKLSYTDLHSHPLFDELLDQLL